MPNAYKHTIISCLIFFFVLNLQADMSQIKKKNHEDYAKIIKLIEIGCIRKAQELKVKLLKDIDSEKELLRNIKDSFKKIIIKREYINVKIKSHELSFICNMYRQNKHYVEAVLDIPNNKKENRKTLINEIGKVSKYSKENKNCIYFPLSGDNKKDRNKIILAFIIKKILEKNNIKSEIIFTGGKKIKQITVVMPDFKRGIKCLSKEKMTITIEKIMSIYYNKIIVKRNREHDARRLADDFRRDNPIPTAKP